MLMVHQVNQCFLLQSPAIRVADNISLKYQVAHSNVFWLPFRFQVVMVDNYLEQSIPVFVTFATTVKPFHVFYSNTGDDSMSLL